VKKKKPSKKPTQQRKTKIDGGTAIAGAHSLSFQERFSELERAICDEYTPEKNPLEWSNGLGILCDLFNSLPVATRNNKSYNLHPAFHDWQEWKAVVVSMIKARVWLRLHTETPFVFQKPEDMPYESLIRLGTVTGQFAKAQWEQVFSMFALDGKIRIDLAKKFFDRIDQRHDNFKRGLAKGFFQTEKSIVSEWVKLDAPPDRYPGCCALDNDSVALFYRLVGHREKEAMAGPNWTRKRKSMGLVKCRKATWRANKGKSCADGVWIEPR
jgi:hypothetical protein